MGWRARKPAGRRDSDTQSIRCSSKLSSKQVNLFKQQGAGAGFCGRAAGGHLVQRARQAAQQRHLVEQQVVHVAPRAQQRPRARLPS